MKSTLDVRTSASLAAPIHQYSSNFNPSHPEGQQLRRCYKDKEPAGLHLPARPTCMKINGLHHPHNTYYPPPQTSPNRSSQKSSQQTHSPQTPSRPLREPQNPDSQPSRPWPSLHHRRDHSPQKHSRPLPKVLDRRAAPDSRKLPCLSHPATRRPKRRFVSPGRGGQHVKRPQTSTARTSAPATPKLSTSEQAFEKKHSMRKMFPKMEARAVDGGRGAIPEGGQHVYHARQVRPFVSGSGSATPRRGIDKGRVWRWR